MVGQTKTKSETIGLGLILALIVICFVAMGQDDRETSIGYLDEEPERWVAFPHDSGKTVYYLRTDQIIAFIEVLDDDLVESGAFGRTNIMVTGGRTFRTDYTFDEIEEVQEFSLQKPAKSATEARQRYSERHSSLEKEKGDE